MRALVVLALVVFATVGLLWIGQRRMIYFPTGGLARSDTLPRDAEAATYETADGLLLSAWFLAADSDRSKGTVVVFNGNAGNRADRLPLGRALVGEGYATLLVDYRGYGGNPGAPSEEGLAEDARAVIAHLRSRPDISPDRIVYFGESLGAAVAVRLASNEPPAALVLRSPFTSLADAGSHHYPYLPVSLLLRDRYENREIIGDVDVPLLIVAGSADTIVPAEQSTQLFEAARHPKTLAIIEGADHNDHALAAGPELIDEVAAFLNDVLASGSG